MKWAVGIGTTNKCNLNCPHCYSREQKTSELDLKSVKTILDSIDIQTVNFGTGENGLNNNFLGIIDEVRSRNIKCSLTSNGYTVLNLKPEYLKYFNDVDISLEFPTEKKQSEFRGKDSWKMAIGGIEKCLENNVEVSIASCMMNLNYNYMTEFLSLISKYNMNLRINIYKPVNTDKYTLTYDQFWNGVKDIFSNFKIIACSEPIINAVLDGTDENLNCACGRKSIRINPSGFVLPCVYWNSTDMHISQLSELNENTFNYIHVIPKLCNDCKYKYTCGGGCSGRRIYGEYGLDMPDQYCPFIRGDKIELDYTMANNNKDLVHASYLCTIIVCS